MTLTLPKRMSVTKTVWPPILGRSLSLMGARVAANVSTLVYLVVLSRLTSAAEFGLLMAGFSGAMLISVGLALNVESGSIRYLVRYRQGGNLAGAAGFLRFNRGLILGFALLSGTGAGLVWAAGWLEPDLRQGQIWGLALAAAPMIAWVRVNGRNATALNQVLKAGVPGMLVPPLVTCLLLAAIWMSGRAPPVWMLMAALVAGFPAAVLVQMIALGPVLADFRGVRPDYADRQEWLSTGIMTAPLLILRDNIKHVIVAGAALTLSAAETGQIALAMSLMGLIHYAIKAIDMSLSPQLSPAILSGRLSAAETLLTASLRLKLVALMAGFGGCLLLGQ